MKYSDKVRFFGDIRTERAGKNKYRGRHCLITQKGKTYSVTFRCAAFEARNKGLSEMQLRRWIREMEERRQSTMMTGIVGFACGVAYAAIRMVLRR